MIDAWKKECLASTLLSTAMTATSLQGTKKRNSEKISCKTIEEILHDASILSFYQNCFQKIKHCQQMNFDQWNNNFYRKASTRTITEAPIKATTVTTT